MKLFSALSVISIACVINAGHVFGSQEGVLESGGLYVDLNNDDCEVGVDGSRICKNNAQEVDEDERESHCTDDHKKCAEWASLGECDANPQYMLSNCMESCNSCLDTMSEDTIEDETYYLTAIQKYGIEQTVSGKRKGETFSKIREAVLYMRDYVHSENPTHNMSEKVKDSCLNKETLCGYWAVIGECDANPAYMVTSCAPVCKTCEKIDIKARCGELDPNAKPSLNRGELNLMFERIVRMAPGNQTEESQLAALEGQVQGDGTPYYTVNVISRPASNSPPPDELTGVVPVNKKRDHDEDPWVITMDNFLTKEESDYLIEYGYQNGYERSKDVGGLKFDGSSEGIESKTRTSANSWCDEKSGCRTDPIVQRVMKRLENTTRIPSDNFEDLQMLKYEVGQFYRIHHDYIEHQKDRLCGPRILTFFLYLSDVDEAGGTGFKDLDITVLPKRGRALLWPSVTNHDLTEMDGRTRHEALTVEKGRKFAANAWIHLYNYQDAQKLGCT